MADLLYGKANPSGRLTVSWPSQATDQPSDYLYNTMPTTYNGNGSVYQPAYPFGFGLSYSTDTQSVSRVSRSGNTVSVRVAVAEHRDARRATSSCRCTCRSRRAQVLVPAKRLAGFTRVSLTAGQSRTVTVRIPTTALGVVQGDIDASGPRTLEAGDYVFSTGTAADPVTPSATNTITVP